MDMIPLNNLNQVNAMHYAKPYQQNVVFTILFVHRANPECNLYNVSPHIVRLHSNHISSTYISQKIEENCYTKKLKQNKLLDY